ncbi:MAG: hypothetical protein JKY52_17445 [Flavobacteriales bacterium]|nr:hypothetical protein [Flavobacteriales bacterium]
MLEEQKPSNGEELGKIQFENEIKRIKLSMEHGFDYLPVSDSPPSPEAESQWLDHIQQFEDSFKNCQKIAIYDRIGRPRYQKVNEISDEEISNELDKVFELLGGNAICLDTICDVPERELYRFITEELFQYETDDIAMEGMVQHYIYEEFHPNHDYDIRKSCTELIDGLLDKERPFNLDYLGMTDEVKLNGSQYELKELGVKMNMFRNAFDDFTLLRYKIVLINIRTRTADVEIDLKFLGILEESTEDLVFEGKGKFRLKHQYDYWHLSALDLPWFDC